MRKSEVSDPFVAGFVKPVSRPAVRENESFSSPEIETLLILAPVIALSPLVTTCVDLPSVHERHNRQAMIYMTHVSNIV